MRTTIAILASLPPLALGHGLISSPPARTPGEATVAACGPKIPAEITSDPTSHVEGLPELGAADNFDPAVCNGKFKVQSSKFKVKVKSKSDFRRVFFFFFVFFSLLDMT